MKKIIGLFAGAGQKRRRKLYPLTIQRRMKLRMLHPTALRFRLSPEKPIRPMT